jgi:signal transduction histidine kinase
MRKLFGGVAALLFALFSLNVAAASDRATEPEAEAMVKKAVQYYDKVGKEKALAEFQKSPGPFVDRDLYVTVYTMDGMSLSHINPKMVGKNMMELRDAKGKYHIRERLEAAKTQDSGWQDFMFYNPVSKKIEPKRMFWEKHDGIVFACGAYKAS